MKKLRNEGWFARALIANPESTIGGRFVYSWDTGFNALNLFHERIRELLKIRNEHHTRDVLEFSEDAVDLYTVHLNEVEMMMRADGYLHDISDAGSKVMENTARVAAILHYFAKRDGKISARTLENAYQIVWYHIRQFKMFFSAECVVPRSVVDSYELERYLHQKFLMCAAANIGPLTACSVNWNNVYRKGPPSLREIDRFAAAIHQLIIQGKVWVLRNPQKTRVIHLNIQYFASLPPY